MNAMRIPAVPIERAEERAPINVFVVSPNSSLRQELQDKLGLPRWNVIQAGSGAGALGLLRQHGADDAVLLLDPMLPDLEPGEFNRMVTDRYPHTQVLLLNSHTGQLLAGSASPNPVSTRLVDAVNRSGPIRSGLFPVPPSEGEGLRTVPEGAIQMHGMIGKSELMQRAYATIRMVAVRDTTVLITGESGTGKDLVAQEIHLIEPAQKAAVCGGELRRHPRDAA